MKTNESIRRITKTVFCAIVLLFFVTTQTKTAKASQMQNMSISLKLPDVMFTCQNWSYLRVIIENHSDKPYKYWKRGHYAFSSPRGMHLDIENIEGNALMGRGTSDLEFINEWHEGKYGVIEPGEMVVKDYLVMGCVLSPVKPGVGRVRLQARDQVTGKMVTFNEEIVEVRNLEDAEREILASEEKIAIEKVSYTNDLSQLIIVTKTKDDRIHAIIPLIGVPVNSELEMAIDKKGMIHVVANAPSGHAFYKTSNGVDFLEHKDYSDGKKRILKKLPDGSVALEVVGGDDESTKEPAGSETNIETNRTLENASTNPDTLQKTNSAAGNTKSSANTPTPQDYQSADSKQTDPKTNQTPLRIVIIAVLAILFLGIALFIMKRISTGKNA